MSAMVGYSNRREGDSSRPRESSSSPIIETAAAEFSPNRSTSTFGSICSTLTASTSEMYLTSQVWIAVRSFDSSCWGSAGALTVLAVALLVVDMGLNLQGVVGESGTWLRGGRDWVCLSG